MSDSNKDKDIYEQMFELLFGDMSADEQAVLRNQLGNEFGLDEEGDPIPSIAPYSAKSTPEQFKESLQSLNCEHMTAHYGGNAWDWVRFEELRYQIAMHFTDGKQNYTWWERYTVVADFSNGVKRVPILYPHHDENDKGVDVTNTENWSDGHYNAYVFGVFVTIMALTFIAEKLYPQNQERGMEFYKLRDAVVVSFKDGLCYGIGDDEICQLARLID